MLGPVAILQLYNAGVKGGERVAKMAGQMLGVQETGGFGGKFFQGHIRPGARVRRKGEGWILVSLF